MLLCKSDSISKQSHRDSIGSTSKAVSSGLSLYRFLEKKPEKVKSANFFPATFNVDMKCQKKHPKANELTSPGFQIINLTQTLPRSKCERSSITSWGV